MSEPQLRFNTPPGWPPPPEGWAPDPDWRPDPSWPPAPRGWSFWVPAETTAEETAASQTGQEVVEDEPAQTPGQTAIDKSDATAPADPETLGDPPLVATETAADEKAASAVELDRVQAELADLRRQTEQERAHLAELKAEADRQAAAAQAAQTALTQHVSGPGPDSEAATVATQIDEARRQLVELNDAVLLQQVGIYEYHHPLENAEAYKERLADLRDRLKDTVRSKEAILTSDRFAYNNSLAQGRKMTADLSKLMLRAYNAEADNCVRSLRAGSIHAAIKRLDTAVESIARLGVMMEMRVSPEYHALRIEELQLTSDFLFKVQEEREAAREEREQLREQRKAEQELAAERERLDKERAHYATAVAALRDQGKADEAADLEARLSEIDAAIEVNDYRVANIRAGYVYVISNLGAFGPNVVKIGLTRRLEPLDRVRELGDASVPFPFDVHAIYFSKDAVELENELHAAFDERRLNRVNLRREFFFATPAQVRDVLTTKVGNLLEFTEVPEATQYFQSHKEWPALEAADK